MLSMAASTGHGSRSGRVLRLGRSGGAGRGVGRNQHTSLSFTENSLFSATCLVTFDPCGEAEGSSHRLLALSSSLVV